MKDLIIDVSQSPGAAGDLSQTHLDMLGRSVARYVLTAEGRKTAELSLLFTDDDEMAELNARYRQKKGPTDVLSFAAAEGDEPLPPEMSHLLGDVVISVARAREQADEAGHSVRREIAFLLIHGILHLLGYDHEKSPEDAEEMNALQMQYLNELDDLAVT